MGELSICHNPQGLGAYEKADGAGSVSCPVGGPPGVEKAHTVGGSRGCPLPHL